MLGVKIGRSPPRLSGFSGRRKFAAPRLSPGPGPSGRLLGGPRAGAVLPALSGGEGLALVPSGSQRFPAVPARKWR